MNIYQAIAVLGTRAQECRLDMAQNTELRQALTVAEDWLRTEQAKQDDANDEQSE